MCYIHRIKKYVSTAIFATSLCIAISSFSPNFTVSSLAEPLNETTASSSSVAATSLPITIRSDWGYDTSGLSDDSYDTSSLYAAGDVLTISSETPMYGLYIKWDNAPTPWTLSYNGKTISCGTNGYVHEYTSIDGGTTQCTITLTENSRISDIYAYSDGSLPSDVQVWESPCESKTDVLVYSTHADDEILFLGGILALYGGEQNLNVQVVYLSNYWNGETVREHEKLDGLWTCGIKNYPVNSPYGDYYSRSLEQAKTTYDYDAVTAYFTAQIRRFKPQVLVTQDFNGEYGHGAHILLANATADALELSTNTEYDPDSISAFGTWNVPKAYFHLYKENTIQLDLRQPSTAFNGKTPLEVVTEAYTKHVSQQKWDFIVSDDYEYSCAEYGLYRTTVGADTGNDILEHVTTYEALEETAKKAEQESIAASKAEQESNDAVTAQDSEISVDEEKTHSTTIYIVIAAFAVIILSVLLTLKLKRK